MILGYIRVSTDGQKDNTSPEEQERAIRGLAMMRGASAYDLQIYSDLGVSGALPLSERPNGSRLLGDMVKGDVVVAAKLDRMFRSSLDALQTAERMKAAGINLVLLDLGHSPVTENGMAEFFFTMVAAFAKLERQRIAERMSDGRRAKQDKNGHCGGYAPFGYRVVGSGRGAHLEPLDSEQKIIAVAKELAKDRNKQRVMHELNARGFRDRAGNEFRYMQIKRMLHG